MAHKQLFYLAMKRNLWLFLLFCSLPVWGQQRSFRPLVEENKVWYNTFAPCFSRNSYKTRYVMAGDTLIGQFTYKKVQVQPFCDRYFFVRETDTCYGSQNSIQNPRAISGTGSFTYSLQPNDTMESMLYFRQSSFIIQHGNYVFRNGVFQFKYHRNYPLLMNPFQTSLPFPVISHNYFVYPYVYDSWIESVGSGRILDYNFKRFVSFDHYIVNCVTVNDSLLYANGPPNCPDYVADISFSGVCLGDTTRIELHACVELDSVIWELPGQAPQKLGGQVSYQDIFMAQAGDYPIKVTTYYQGTAMVIEKYLEIRSRIAPFSLGPDLNVCGNNAQITSPVSASYYEWSNYDTSKTLNVPGPGKYWLTVGHYGCLTQSDTIEVNFYGQPDVKVPQELELCPNDSIELDAYGGFYNNANCSYAWSNGNSSRFTNYRDSGWHSLRIYNQACADTGYFHITHLPLPRGFTSDSLLVCSAAKVTIHSPDSVMIWGSLSDTQFQVPVDTLFQVEISNGLCRISDSIRVLNAEIQAPFDTLALALCPGDSLELNLDSLAPYRFLWSDGSTEQKRMLFAQQNRLLQLDLSDRACQKSVWVNLRVHPKIPPLFPDTPYVICPMSELRLAIPSPFEVSYAGFTYSDSLLIQQAGNHRILVQDLEACIDQQVVSVRAIAPLPIYDSISCFEQVFKLPEPSGFVYSLPPIPDPAQGELRFSDAGTYRLYVQEQGCFFPVMNLELYPGCGLFIPSAFTPNKDGLNDAFEPETNGQYVELNIYDRWGSCIFRYAGTQPRWDGFHQGVACPAGLYLYELVTPYSRQSTRSYRGTLSLLR